LNDIFFVKKRKVEESKVFKTIVTIITIFILAILFGALSALITCILFMLAWNYLIPVFHLPHLDFWHAFAVVFLISLFGTLFRSALKVDKAG
jgi:hypothetical protein